MNFVNKINWTKHSMKLIMEWISSISIWCYIALVCVYCIHLLFAPLKTSSVLNALFIQKTFPKWNINSKHQYFEWFIFVWTELTDVSVFACIFCVWRIIESLNWWKTNWWWYKLVRSATKNRFWIDKQMVI